MAGSLEALVSSLLYEGYCLYPYTPGAVKNATPTPFGIVYPPQYAAAQSSAFDHVQMECILEGPPGALLAGSVIFLQANGEGHRAVDRRVEITSRPIVALAREAGVVPFAFESGPDRGLEGRLIVSIEPVGDGVWRAGLRVENQTRIGELAPALDRRGALERSLLSTHVVLQVQGGRFVSPLERGDPHGVAVAACRNVNTWPVLATPADDAVLGAAIFLPDHPQIAPESKVNFFDNTEIEEALMLHVQVLSDEERAAIGGQDGAVREMIARATAASPEERLRQHGVMKPVERPGPASSGREDGASGNLAYMTRPRAETIPGEERFTVGGVEYRRGGKVLLRLAGRIDPYVRALDGKIATIERLYIDYEDQPYLVVTIDGDPAQDLLRDTGRFLYFAPQEAEVIEP